jgi:hypothetical protein
VRRHRGGRPARGRFAGGAPGGARPGGADLHHKDPVDAQGVYDALVEARQLAETLGAVQAGRLRWEQGLERYRCAVRDETHAMFRATLRRLEREVFQEPPALVIRTVLKWLMEDPEYQRRFLLFLSRAIPRTDGCPPRWS